MTRTRTQGPLYEYMVKHPGEVTLVGDLAATLKLTEDQVKKGMQLLLKRPGSGIVCQHPGTAWMYSPKTARVGRIFEEVRVGKSGKVIIEDEDGNFFYATPLE